MEEIELSYGVILSWRGFSQNDEQHDWTADVVSISKVKM